MPRGLEPINVSRLLARRPKRESTDFESRPSFVSDDLLGLNRPAVDVEHEAVSVPRQRTDGARELDRQLEMLGVPLEAGDDLVTGRIAVRVAREREARERVVAPWREEDERVPAAPPATW